MAAGKEIRNKIQSVKNTQKITKAMEMVAASKMRKAQDRMRASRPYTNKIHEIVGHMAYAHTEYKHPFLNARVKKRVGYIVVSSDKGLCGGLNVNLFKLAVSDMKKNMDQNVGIDLALCGRKAVSFFKRIGGNVLANVNHLGDEPKLEELIGVLKVMIDAYNTDQIDRLYIVQNSFVNTMTQKPEIIQLLPVARGEDMSLNYHWDYIYEPDSKGLIDATLQRYLESLLYQAVVENISCEMAARMVAMKSATDNATEVINRLQLAYNKERQASITQELSEIVAGAAAV
ncbi:MAG: F0F1 ATP synthase subunit gamma [Gammaproteobacteria bacterium]|nr:F0F1 ATP synthase subunit gamma [Gammaproteobacteria bacterium]